MTIQAPAVVNQCLVNPLMNQLNIQAGRKYQAIGYKLAPLIPGRALAEVSRRILGDCYSYSDAVVLATLWKAASDENRALVVLSDSPTLRLPSLVELSKEPQ